MRAATCRGSEIVQYTRTNSRPGGALAGVIVYLVGFTLLMLAMLHWFFGPAAAAMKGADLAGRKQLGAVAWLMLSITIVYLIAGLFLVFRIGRFFFPRPRAPRVRTPHVDIWSEAGKRLDEKKMEE
jgi:hypothetical protein